MKDRYEIDDFMRRKLENRAFEYDHANWVSAVEYIEQQEAKKKRGFLFWFKNDGILGSILIMALVSSLFMDPLKDNSTTLTWVDESTSHTHGIDLAVANSTPEALKMNSIDLNNTTAISNTNTYLPKINEYSAKANINSLTIAVNKSILSPSNKDLLALNIENENLKENINNQETVYLINTSQNESILNHSTGNELSNYNKNNNILSQATENNNSPSQATENNILSQATENNNTPSRATENNTISAQDLNQEHTTPNNVANETQNKANEVAQAYDATAIDKESKTSTETIEANAQIASQNKTNSKSAKLKNESFGNFTDKLKAPAAFLYEKTSNNLNLVAGSSILKNIGNNGINISPTAGLLFNYSLNKNETFHFSFGALYSYRSGLNDIQYQSSNTNFSFGFNREQSSITNKSLQYLDVPLLFSFNYHKHLEFYAGGLYSNLINTKQEITTFQENSFGVLNKLVDKQNVVSERYSSADWSVIGGVGYRFNDAFTLRTQLRFGFTDLTNNASFGNNGFDRNMGLGFNLIFKPVRK